MEPLHPEDPETCGPYPLLARLGEGGMGRVYLARSPGGRDVAVKVVHADLAHDPGFRARFRREVTAARAVSGAFTAPVVDADPEAESPWLATVFLPGLSLEEAVTRHGPLPSHAVAALAAALAEGLASVHGAGIVHRDLKPSNVMLTPEGPRVIDFGVARPADEGALTQSGMAVGSPGYMSPEQARGEETGPAGDVFSLGAVLTFAATGDTPFGTGPMHATLYRLLHESPDLDRVSPEDLRVLLAACLERDLARRPTLPQISQWALARLPRHAVPQGREWLPSSVTSDITQRAEHTLTGPIRTTAPAAPRKVGRRLVLGWGAAGLATGLGVMIGGSYLSYRWSQSDKLDYEWTHRPADKRRLFGGPYAVGDLLLTVTDEDEVLALHRRTGTFRWRAPVEDAWPKVEPALIGDTVVVRGVNGLTGLDARTGRQRWRKKLMAPNDKAGLVGYGGLLYTAGEPERPITPGRAQPDLDGLFALDVMTGEPRWHRPTGAKVTGTPLVALDRLYVGGDALHALDRTTGKVLWRRSVGSAVTGSPAAGVDRIFVVTADSALHALDAATGRPLWRAATDAGRDPGTGRPFENTSGWQVRVMGQTVYTGSPADKLYAFDAATGRKRWEYLVGGGKGKAAASIAPDHLLPVATAYRAYLTVGNRLIALDAATGEVQWQQQLVMAADQKPVPHRGLLFLGTEDGIVALSEQTGQVTRRGTDFATARVTLADEVLYYVGGHVDDTYIEDRVLYALRPSHL